MPGAGRGSHPRVRARRRQRLTACVDVAVAGQDAVFGFSEVRLGIVPAVISPFVLPKLGPGAARRYFLTGERFDASTALRIGLVHEVTAELDAAVERVVADLLAGGPKAVREAKRLVRDAPDAPRSRTGRRGSGRAPRGRKACARSWRARGRVAIRKLLVANCGEIAVRIFGTCERLGVETVAVAARDDGGALHTRRAGETVRIASYLDPDEHVRAALESGADAVHPGWLPGGERRAGRGRRRGRARLGRPSTGRAAGRGRQARREADCRGGGRAGRADGLTRTSAIRS